MIRRTAGVLLCGLAVFLAVGCLPRQPQPDKVHNYTLDYEPPQASGPGLEAVIKVQPFSEAPPYASRMMVYQERDLQPEQDYYRRWRSDPGDLIAYFLRRDLRQSGLFRAVLPLESEVSGTHTLEGTVERLLEIETARGRKAVLTLSATLLRNNVSVISQKVIFQKTYQAEQAVEGSEAGDVARAVSRGLREISRELMRDLHRAIQSEGRRNRSGPGSGDAGRAQQ
jgi:ABC-type uncharacterized transport system auxiliary subunit